MINIEDRLYTIEEYFAMVEESHLKIEYHRGQLFAQVVAPFLITSFPSTPLMRFTIPCLIKIALSSIAISN